MDVWIKVYHDLSDHAKTYALAETLSIKQYSAVGIVVSLWTWAVINAPDGDLQRFPDGAIARACFWDKSPAALVKALTDCRWLDEGRRIHDWDVYAGALIEAVNIRREKTRKRVEAYRAKQRVTEPLQAEDCNADVTRYTTVTEPLRNASGNAGEEGCNADVTPLRTRTRTITRYNTHDQIQHAVNTRAREGEEDPGMEVFDEAWRDSPQVRAAVAQRVISYVRETARFDDTYVVTEGGQVGRDLHRALTAAMETGVSPERCREAGLRYRKTWLWEAWAKEKAMENGSDIPEAWVHQVNELAEDLDEAEASSR